MSGKKRVSKRKDQLGPELTAAQVSELQAAAKSIKALDRKMVRQARQYVMDVGPYLEQAQAILTADKDFSRWLKENQLCSRSLAYYLIDASKVMHQLKEEGVKPADLPANESQCRDLKQVPEDKRTEAWQAILASAKEAKKPVTAKRISDTLVGLGHIEPKSPPAKRVMSLEDILEEWTKGQTEDEARAVLMAMLTDIYEKRHAAGTEFQREQQAAANQRVLEGSVAK